MSHKAQLISIFANHQSSQPSEQRKFLKFEDDKVAIRLGNGPTPSRDYLFQRPEDKNSHFITLNLLLYRKR